MLQSSSLAFDHLSVGVSVVFDVSSRRDRDEQIDPLVYVVAVFAHTLSLRSGCG